MTMTMDELMKVLDMQEDILQFTHFTNADAWELGTMILMEARRRGAQIGIMIRNLSHAGHCYGCHNADFFHADRKTSAQHCVFLRVQYHLFYALRRIRRCHVKL